MDWIEIGILTTALIAGFFGLRSETWDKKAKGFKKLTVIGRWIGLLMIVSFVLAIAKGVRDGRADEQKESQRTALSNEVSSTRVLLGSAHGTITQLNTTILALSSNNNYLIEESIQRLPVPQDGFQLVIKTAKIAGKADAGTDAPVYARLKGTKRSSGWLRLNTQGNDFEEGASNTFFPPLTPALGELTHIDLKRDAAPGDAGWRFESCRIADLKRAERIYEVKLKNPNGGWLHSDKDKGGLSRTFPLMLRNAAKD